MGQKPDNNQLQILRRLHTKTRKTDPSMSPIDWSEETRGYQEDNFDNNHNIDNRTSSQKTQAHPINDKNRHQTNQPEEGLVDNQAHGISPLLYLVGRSCRINNNQTYNGQYQIRDKDGII